MKMTYIENKLKFSMVKKMNFQNNYKYSKMIFKNYYS